MGMGITHPNLLARFRPNVTSPLAGEGQGGG